MMERLDNRRIRGDGNRKRADAMPATLKGALKDSKSHHQLPSHLSSPSRTSFGVESLSGDKCPVEIEADHDGIIRVPSGSGYRIMTPFPWRLHEMLEDIEEKKLNWIVSWMPDGKAFQVHSSERFSDTIIPMYFRHKRYKSFQRQLYLYGFRSLQVNSICKGAYFHPCFVRNNRPLCRQILRPKSARTSTSRCRSRSRSTKASKVGNIDVFARPDMQIDAETEKLAPAIGFEKTLLDSPFEPLSCDRGASAILASSEGSKGPVEIQNGAHSALSYLFESVTPNGVEHEFINDDLQVATQFLLRNLQHTMLGTGLPIAFDGETPLVCSTNDGRKGNKMPRSLENIGLRPRSINDGPILSISTGDRTFMNFKRHPPDEGAGLGPDLLPARNVRLASIQQLEPFSDSIITLFGSTSKFSE